MPSHAPTLHQDSPQAQGRRDQKRHAGRENAPGCGTRERLHLRHLSSTVAALGGNDRALPRVAVKTARIFSMLDAPQIMRSRMAEPVKSTPKASDTTNTTACAFARSQVLIDRRRSSALCPLTTATITVSQTKALAVRT
jgi:hypothetical protein